MYYILKGQTPVPCERREWIAWVTGSGRKQGQVVKLNWQHGRKIQTMFLGLDHSFGKREPILFQTMVADPHGGILWLKRTSSWQQAENAHADALLWEYELNSYWEQQ
jgi:hypothetical protein